MDKIKVKFRDVAKNIKITIKDINESGLSRYVAGEHMDSEDLKLNRYGEIGEDYLGPAFNVKFLKGQILYGSRRTYLRKVAVADFDGITSNTTFVIESTGDKLLPELLPFIMQTEEFNQHSIDHSKGSVNPYINWKDIAEYEFYIPKIEHQKEIANLLLAVEDSLQTSKTLLEKTIIYRNLLLNFLVNKNDYKEYEINDVIECSSEKFNPNKEEEVYPCIELEHISQETGKILGHTISKEQKSTKNKFKANDVLFGKLRPYLRKYAMPNFEGVCSSEIIVLKSKDTGKISNKYIFYLIQSEMFQRIANITQGTKMPRADWNLIKTYSIKIPDINEQNNILNLLGSLDDTIINIEKKIENNKEMKKSLLNNFL